MDEQAGLHRAMEMPNVRNQKSVLRGGNRVSVIRSQSLPADAGRCWRAGKDRHRLCHGVRKGPYWKVANKKYLEEASWELCNVERI